MGLVFVSKWQDAKAAAEFAAIYARGIQQRYGGAEVPATLPSDLKTLQTLGGDHTWKTDQGPVVIAVKDDIVLVTESLEPKLTEEFRHEVLTSHNQP